MTHPYTRLFILPAPPDADNDSTEGYEVGDVVHVEGGSVYDCRDNTEGAAVWEERGSGGGGGLPNPFALTADITPTTLSANVNNYEPTGAGTADIWRLEASGTARSVTGIAGGADGRILVVHNIGSTFNVVLVNESGSSSAANRLALGGNDVNIGPGLGVVLQYDATLSRWYPLTTQDHTKLANIGNFTHASIDSHINNLDKHLPIVNGSAVLGSNFDITGTAGTYQATGLSITLPAAGTYKITGNIRGALNGNAGTRWEMYAKLRNTTDGADITNSETLIVLTASSGFHLQNTAPIDILVTVAASKTIEVYAARAGAGTPSWTISQISSNSIGWSRLMYEKIG